MHIEYIFRKGRSSVAKEQRSVGDAGLGITEGLIHDLVHAFYRQVRAGAELGPIFEQAIAGNWDRHLAKMCDFWSSVMLKSAHIQLDALQPHHFDRWLGLFRRTAREICPPSAAVAFIDRAERIAESLRRSLIADRASRSRPVVNDDAAKPRFPILILPEPPPARARTAEVPGSVYHVALAGCVWILAAFWLLFGAETESAFMVAVSTGFFILYLGVPWLMMRVGRQGRPAHRQPLAEFLKTDIETHTGLMGGPDVLVQIALLPCLSAVTVTVMGICLVLIRGGTP